MGGRKQTPENTERVLLAIRLRSRGLTWGKVAEACQWNSPQAAFEAVKRELGKMAADMTLAVDELRAVELEHLNELRVAAMGVLERRHFATGSGPEGSGTVFLTDPESGEYLTDDAPTLAAIDKLLKVAERMAKLAGLDSPVKVEGGQSVTVEIVGVDMAKLRGEK